MKKCKVCESSVSQNELKCGLCKHLRHIKCSKLQVADAVFVNNDTNNNIHWFCDDCEVLLQSDFLRSLLSKVTKLETVVEKIDNNMSILINNQPKGSNQDSRVQTPASNTRGRKRKANLEDIASDVPNTKKPSQDEEVRSSNEDSHNKTFRNVVTEQTSEESNPEIAVAPQAIEEKGWIFVSRLKPDTTSATLSMWLKSKLKTDEVLCFPLIPRGVQLNELKMISFKMAVPMSLMSAAKNRTNCGHQEYKFVILLFELFRFQ